MSEIPVLTTSRRVKTPRLETRVLFSGPEDGVPVIFVHGKGSARQGAVVLDSLALWPETARPKERWQSG